MTSVRRYASISIFGAVMITAAAPVGIAGEYAVARFTGTSGNRCAAYGPDFAAVEGSNACVRIGGRVRVQIGGNTGLFGKPSDPVGRASSAELRLDKPLVAEPSHLRVHGALAYPNPFR